MEPPAPAACHQPVPAVAWPALPGCGRMHPGAVEIAPCRRPYLDEVAGKPSDMRFATPCRWPWMALPILHNGPPSPTHRGVQLTGVSAATAAQDMYLEIRSPAEVLPLALILLRQTPLAVYERAHREAKCRPRKTPSLPSMDLSTTTSRVPSARQLGVVAQGPHRRHTNQALTVHAQPRIPSQWNPNGPAHVPTRPLHLCAQLPRASE
mmetsp:Transcript_44742/g.127724  ORF Transcript_44742/g.127724 Transcript_44742/m.127724 type:complete len:208 (+) Transcript_44742:1774-2397(+)